MVTLVGTQDEFKDAVISLLALEYDALEAYKTAISKLEDKKYKNKMQDFMHDHEKHIKMIEQLLHDHSIKFDKGPSAKQMLTKGKVIIADLIGDKAILIAMLSNEADTNSAYKRMSSRKDYWKDAHDLMKHNLIDEQKHKEWLEQTLSNLD